MLEPQFGGNRSLPVSAALEHLRSCAILINLATSLSPQSERKEKLRPVGLVHLTFVNGNAMIATTSIFSSDTTFAISYKYQKYTGITSLGATKIITANCEMCFVSFRPDSYSLRVIWVWSKHFLWLIQYWYQHPGCVGSSILPRRERLSARIRSAWFYIPVVPQFSNIGCI